MSAIEEGDLVGLVDGAGRRYLVTVRKGTEYVEGVGTFDRGDLAGRSWGSSWGHGNKTFRLVRPTPGDLQGAAHPRAQVVLPKDASRILWETGLQPGDRVVEAGLGSGYLTLALARAVAPDGEVVGYETRSEHADVAEGNLEQAGLRDVVTVRRRDVYEGVDAEGLQAAVLDLADPQDAIPGAAEALEGSGVLASYSPQVSQVERTHDALEEAGFFDVRTMEVLERTWTVADHGSRPDHDALGHTGFLTFGRKAVDDRPPGSRNP